MYYRTLPLLVISAVALTPMLNGEIHRAKQSPYKSPKRPSDARVRRPVDVAQGTEMLQTESGHETEEWGADDNYATREMWIYSIAGAMVVGSSGILPLLVLPIEAGPSLRHGAPAARLKLMLSFAVGSLLGDVFCHLLPEVWNFLDTRDPEAHTRVGLLVIAGLIFFMVVEKVLGDETEFEPLEDTCDEIDSHQETHLSKPAPNNQSQIGNGKTKLQPEKQSQTSKPASFKQHGHTHERKRKGKRKGENGGLQKTAPSSVSSNYHTLKNSQQNGRISVSESSQLTADDSKNQPHVKVSGYLNLFANIVDNFTHGLAVGGSFLISRRVGLLTTGAILIHEIPHEVGDFAILLRSGFDRWKAAKAQVLTATSGVFGAITALTAEQAGEKTAWILAFTSGGFLYIALVTVVPDLMQEKHPRESLKQMSCLLLGILCMICVTCFSG